jgi:hypothetical protein
MNENPIRIAHVDAGLLNRLRAIMVDTAMQRDRKKQVATLAEAILAVDAHCTAVENTLRALEQKINKE